ncbi:S-layer domain protein [Bacillus mycoides]|uniref:S-layer domain protein n=1 Tax=Bacillus mycoides TaxID=1405 RepID=C2XUB8_BACMY|nr:S-layer domain protein [Bacillus mycoides]
MVIMIDRSLQYKNIIGKLVDLPFSDQNLVYDKQAVQRVYGLGIVKGNEKNEFIIYAQRYSRSRRSRCLSE